MKKSKLFSKIALILLTTMLIPFMTVLSLFWFTQNTTQELTENASERVLSQFFSVVDNTLTEASTTVLTIARNQDCLQYSQYIASNQPEKASGKVLEVRDRLREMSNQRYQDVFVYYPKDGRVISGINGSTDADTYFAANYGGTGYNREEYASVLDMSVYRPHIFTIGSEKQYLCVGMQQSNRGNGDRDFMVVLVMEPKFISDLILENEHDGQGALMIFDHNRNLLISSDDSNSYAIDWYDGEASRQDIETENGKYMLQVMQASAIEGYYAYATSEHMFAGLIDRIHIVSVAVMLLGLVMGCIAVFMGTSQVYTPIKRVAEKAGAKDGKKRASELDIIASALDESAKDRDRTNYLERKNTHNERKAFLRAWVYGNIQTENLPDLLEQHGIVFAYPHYVIGVICFNSKGQIAGDQLDFVAQNVFEEKADQIGKGYVVGFSENQFVLILNFKCEDDLTHETNVWEDVCEFFKKCYDAEVSVYFSKVYGDKEEVATGFKEALEVARYRYLLWDKRCLDYSNIRDREFVYTSALESRLSRAVMDYIRRKTKTVPEKEFVQKLFRIAEISAESSIDTVECFCYEMYSILSNAIALYRCTAQCKPLLDNLMSSQTLGVYQDALAQLLEALVKCKQEHSKAEELCNQVTELIYAQYADTQLSLNSIGEAVRRSPYYVSKLFKEECGVSVADYIARTRIDHAKRLLRETDDSIHTIAGKTGFLSSTVLIRAFKRLEGITPGKYRSLNKENLV